MRDVEITSFSGNNFDSIIELTNAEYEGREIASERYLYWEYVMNPNGHSIMHLAQSNGKLAAQYAVIPRQFNFSGNVIKGSLSVNTLTHPDFRGKNLFKQLAEKTFEVCRKQGILFTIGFPNRVSLPVIGKKNIFSITGSLVVLFRPLNPVNTFFRYLSNRSKSGEEIALTVDTHIGENIFPFDISSSSTAYTKMLREFNFNTRLTTHRDVDFFKWRYIDIPRRTYHSVIYGNDDMKALIVLRAKYIYGIRCLIIVDIISIDQHAVKKLLNEVDRIAKENKIALIFSALPRHSEEYVTLKSKGFYSVPDFILPQKLNFIVRKHRDDCPDEVMNFENWFLTFGDYDIF
jgi:hypothetical protein